MGKQRISQRSRKSYRRLCCKKLSRQGAGKSDGSQKHQNSGHFQNIPRILIPDSYINHTGYYQGNKQLKAGLQHLKQRSQYAFHLIIL